MGYERTISAQTTNTYQSEVGATNQPENIVIRYVNGVSLSRIFAYKVGDVFMFSFTDFLLVYRTAFAHIFPRSQPMRESNTDSLFSLQ
jgi:hypothetical protein